MRLMKRKFHVKKDDIVEIVTGKEKGKKGKVLALFPGEDRVQVEKLNMVKCHVKPTQKNNQGGIVEKEGKIHISNVLVVSDKVGRGVRTRYKKLEDGKKVRVCRKSGEIIDKV